MKRQLNVFRNAGCHSLDRCTYVVNFHYNDMEDGSHALHALGSKDNGQGSY